MLRDQSTRDPCCGMRVDPATAEHIDHAGNTYYFCSKHCADAFALNPQKFLRNPPHPNPYRLLRH